LLIADVAAGSLQYKLNMSIDWNKDFDAALNQASQSGKPALLDFSAAPM